jgi:hypothetical protein
MLAVKAVMGPVSCKVLRLLSYRHCYVFSLLAIKYCVWNVSFIKSEKFRIAGVLDFVFSNTQYSRTRKHHFGNKICFCSQVMGVRHLFSWVLRKG